MRRRSIPPMRSCQRCGRGWRAWSGIYCPACVRALTLEPEGESMREMRRKMALQAPLVGESIRADVRELLPLDGMASAELVSGAGGTGVEPGPDFFSDLDSASVAGGGEAA